MNNNSPPSSPSSVYNSPEMHHYNNDTDPSQATGAFGIKLAADPYFYYKLDQRHPPTSSPQELMELKLQIARQQEKIDSLSSSLSKFQLENEALKAKNSTLLSELAKNNVSSDRNKERHHQPSPSTKVIPNRRNRRASQGDSDDHLSTATSMQKMHLPRSNRRASQGDPSSVQLLLATNAKLTMENSRLEVLSDVTRKSFQSFIEENRRSAHKDKETIARLQDQIDALLRQQQETQIPRVVASSRTSTSLNIKAITNTTTSKTFSVSPLDTTETTKNSTQLEDMSSINYSSFINNQEVTSYSEDVNSLPSIAIGNIKSVAAHYHSKNVAPEIRSKKERELDINHGVTTSKRNTKASISQAVQDNSMPNEILVDFGIKPRQWAKKIG